MALRIAVLVAAAAFAGFGCGAEPGGGDAAAGDAGGLDADGGGGDASVDAGPDVGICGDGVVQSAAGEACDGTELAGTTCESLGFDGGVLRCSTTCSLDTSGCLDGLGTCGDGVIEGEEQCEGDDLGGLTCEDFFFDHGVLRCREDCRVSTRGCNNVPVCGDGVVEEPEACDDGNSEDQDGCASDCVIERCGDGVVQPELGEECEDDAIVLECESDELPGIRLCEDDCTLGALLCPSEERCGDGVVDVGEECDDGNAEDGDGCSATCTAEATCGDGIADGEESCDGDDLGGATCATLGFDAGTLACAGCALDPTGCRTIRCGDGFVDGDEECDDGGVESGDGCSRRCRIERCGDGRRQAELGEQCDGDDVAGFTCADFGFRLGPVACTDRCRWDLSTCEPLSTCGDGVVDEGEECDDGGNSAGDGCGPACRRERCGDGIVQAGEQCEPDLHVDATCEELGLFAGRVSCAADCSYDTSACATEPPTECGDGVAEGDEECDGDDLRGRTCAELGFDFGAVRCDDACSLSTGGCGAEPTCGDGVAEGEEACDDGNNDSGDGCSGDCVEERCGDGVLQPGLGEECELGSTRLVTCEDGRPGLARCDGTCRLADPECPDAARCGDGTLDVGEACDDGNSVDGDGCSSECTSEGCGDGVLQAGEACEPRGETAISCEDFGFDAGEIGCTEACAPDLGECRTIRCGDGIVEGDERCDDGNDEAFDGCSPRCELERCGDGALDLGEACDDGEENSDDEPDACRTDCTLPACGDGVLDEGEACDDGNLTSGDGCTNDCVVERCGDRVLQPDLGEECELGSTRVVTCDDGSPGLSRCDAECQLLAPECAEEGRCGDGRLDVGEGCDDGNTEDGDGCSSTCRSEGCGDGVLQPSEACEPGGEASVTCDDFGFDAGEIGCTDECAPAFDGCRSIRCGDGFVDGDEACDDGNDEAFDGCSPRCELERCGDGVLDPAEACDDGADNSDVEPDACRTDCTLPSCGDEVVDEGEACDDGDDNSDEAPDACRTDCTLPSCGDGVVDDDEVCDDGDDNSDEEPDACRTDCVPARCGDGVVDSAESCEPGGPGPCRSDCTVPRCGDGIVDEDEGEECDDGGALDADGCSATCLIERPPEALFDATPTRGVGPLLVEVDASASSDADGEIVAFAWDFGDGSTATGVTASHSYAPGIYELSLTVTDDDGLSDTATVIIDVNAAPDAVLTTDRTTGCDTVEITFDASESSDSDGEIVSRELSIDDDRPTIDELPTTVTLGPGTWTATLVVTDDRGASASATVTITVVDGGVEGERVWLGGDEAAPRDWSVGENWCPPAAPGAGERARIPGTIEGPSLSESAAVGALEVSAGATVDVGLHRLTVAGELVAEGAVTGEGTVAATGAVSEMRGHVSTNLEVLGEYGLSGDLRVERQMEVLTDVGSIEIGGHTASVGNLTVRNDGLLVMAQADDRVIVDGDAHFSGMPTAGFLTAGELRIGGDLDVRNAGIVTGTFEPTGAHTVVLDGDALQTVTVQSSAITAGRSKINRLVVENREGVVFGNNVTIAGEARIVRGEASGVAATLGDDLFLESAGAWSVDRTTIFGDNPTLPSRFDTSVVLRSSWTIERDTTILGDLDITGEEALLTIGAATLQATGGFEIAFEGRLALTDATSVLDIDGAARFVGGDTSASLTTGTIRLAGHLDVDSICCTRSNTFSPSGDHTLILDGTERQELDISASGRALDQAHIANLVVANPAGVQFMRRAVVTGDVSVDVGDVSGSEVELGGDLILEGGATWSPSTTELFGADQTMPATMATHLLISGQWRPTRPSTSIDGPLTVSGEDALLAIGDARLEASGAFKTEFGGLLTMSSAGGVLDIGGDARFVGGDTSSLLTAGTLHVGGRFDVDTICCTFSYTFAPSGDHVTVLDGTASQAVDMNGAGAAPTQAHFRHLVIDNAAGVEFERRAVVTGDTTVRAANVVGSEVELGGDLTLDEGATWSPSTTELFGADQTMPAAMATHLIISGQWQPTRVSTSIDGPLTVSGEGALLAIGDTRLEASGAFKIEFGGLLTMLDAGGVLDIGGDARFVGGDTSSVLTAGRLHVGGRFDVDTICCTVSYTFAPSDDHVTVLDGTASQAVDMNGAGAASTQAHFRHLVVDNAAGVEFERRAVVTGDTTVRAGVVSGFEVELGGDLVLEGDAAWATSATELFGAGQQMPELLTTNLEVSGQWTPTRAATTIDGDVAIRGEAARLVLGDATLHATGALAVEFSGLLVMDDVGGVLDIDGDARFNGADTEGSLTAGTLHVGGRLDVDVVCCTATNTFSPSEDHMTILDGSAPQVVDMNGAGAAANASHFHHLTLANASSIEFVRRAVVTGDTSLTAGETVGTTVALGGDLALVEGTSWNVTTTEIFGIGQALPSTLGGSLTIEGDWQPTIAETVIAADLLVEGADARLDVADTSVRVLGDFETRLGGRVEMTSASGLLDVEGDVRFAGGDTSASLTAGTITVGGDFSAETICCTRSNTFSPSGDHVVRFDGTASQSIALETSGRAAEQLHFANLVVANATGIDFARRAVVLGATSVEEGAATGLNAELGGDLTVEALGSWEVTQTELFGALQTIPPSLPGALVVSGQWTVSQSTTIDGDVTISGAGAALDVGDQQLVVRGALETTDNGVLVMTDPLGRLEVDGPATFRGGDTSGLLTAGTLTLRGDFEVDTICCTRANTFVASGSLETMLDGTALQTVHVAGMGTSESRSHLAQLQIAPGASVQLTRGPLIVIGDSTVHGDLEVVSPITFDTVGNLTFSSTATVTNGGTISYGGTIDQSAASYTGDPPSVR